MKEPLNNTTKIRWYLVYAKFCSQMGGQDRLQDIYERIGGIYGYTPKYIRQLVAFMHKNKELVKYIKKTLID
ncbi:hypothetical protein FACS1894153_4330 [Bacteroidia bacterium]|nr:hypothetical protein FACS1894153_4330 [Bacteroidia bacterium]